MPIEEIENLKTKTDNISDLRKRKLIISITKQNDWYKKVSLDTFASILMDLEYSKDDAIALFKRINIRE